MAKTFTIRLTSQEMGYLSNAKFLAPNQIEALRVAESSNAVVALRISRESAEKFREAFTEELAKVGFDENYDLTPEGRILEDLIDRFYIAQ